MRRMLHASSRLSLEGVFTGWQVEVEKSATMAAVLHARRTSILVFVIKDDPQTILCVTLGKRESTHTETPELRLCEVVLRKQLLVFR